MKTTYYMVRVKGKTFPLLSLSGRDYDEALEYIRGIWPTAELEMK